MVKTWKDHNLLRESEELERGTRAPYLEGLLETLQNSLKTVTEELQNLETERKNTFGNVNDAEWDNKKHPRYELHKLYLEAEELTKEFKDDPDPARREIYENAQLSSNFLRKVWYNLGGREELTYDREKEGYNQGYKNSKTFTFSDDWIEPVMEVFDAAGYTEEEKEDFINRVRAAQKKSAREMPILAKYCEDIYALKQLKKSFTEAIKYLQKLQ